MLRHMSGLGYDAGLDVAQDLVGRPGTLRCPALHVALEVDRTVLAGEVALSGLGIEERGGRWIGHAGQFVPAERGVLTNLPEGV